MPATREHTATRPPDHEYISIWRYMDFTKYVHLLGTRALYFARSDRFDDPFEGSYSKHNIEIRPKIYAGKIPEDRIKNMSKMYEYSRAWTYISCWHMNDYESAAMWKLYSNSNEAIAIQSTYKKLCDILPKDVLVGRVEYIDYENDWLPEGNVFYPFFHKRKSFEHEKELRAITQDYPVVDGEIKWSNNNTIFGKLVNVPLEELIKRVYVAPTANNWFYELVMDVTEKYGFKFGIIKSCLDEKPVY